jgi:hypothetical protein
MRTGLLATLVALILTAPARAQGSASGTPEDQVGQRIVAQAKAQGKKLNEGRAKTATISGKKFQLIPADFSAMNPAAFKDGVFVGMLDTEASVAEDVSLLPGRYDLYVGRISGEWIGYAERNGRLVRAKRVVERPDTPPDMDPTFSPGNCWWLWLVITGLNLCW